MKKSFLAVLISLSISQAFADTKIVSNMQMQVDTPDKPTGKSMTITLLIKGNLMRKDVTGANGAESTYTIYDAKMQKLFVVNPTLKMVTVADTSAIQQLKGISQQLLAGITVQKTGKTSTMNGISCDEYLLSQTQPINMSATVCAANMEIKDLKMIQSMQGDFSAFSDLIKKIPGTPISISMQMNMGGRKLTSSYQITSISNEPIPESQFLIPADYKVMMQPQKPQMNPTATPITTPVTTSPVSTPSVSTPLTTTPPVSAPSGNTPTSTTPASTTPASTTPASTTPVQPPQ